MDMYGYFDRVRACYGLLQDELSRKIFRARLYCDLDGSRRSQTELVALGEQQKWLEKLGKRALDISQQAKRDQKKLVLYGTNVTGRAIAEYFMENGIGFYGFCGRRAREFKDGLMGKPVIPPDLLFRRPEEFYVIVAAEEAADEIVGILRENGFPGGQILFTFRTRDETDHQYFEFPELFPRGTAFVDAGCLDCRSSYLFARWCGGEYSRIFAFEPDPISCSVCERGLEERPIRGFELIKAGLSDREGVVSFRGGLYGCSYVVREGGGDGGDQGTMTEVPVTTIDKTVGDERVGFIKMDIEGSELRAILGARGTVSRDRPLMAISVYHLPGDMTAIMDCLHDMVPEYRFWLRHYSIGSADTVLYASAGAR